MDLRFDLVHVVGYLGALGSLVFGLNQLRIIISKQTAKDISLFDYAVRVVYSILLGIYSIAIGNVVFVVVNFGAALLSACVAGLGLYMKVRHRAIELPRLGGAFAAVTAPRPRSRRGRRTSRN